MRTRQEHDVTLFPARPGDRHPHREQTAHLKDATELTAYLLAERETLLNRIRRLATHDQDRLPPPEGLGIAREFSDLMDGVITRLFELSCERVNVVPARLPITLVATGGYGRRELCPFSDIDITFVPLRDGDPQVDRVLREMFTGLMDILMTRCGLEVGYAYRLMEDFGSLDHQTLCGLLDARYICGSERLFIQLEDAYWTHFNATEFLFAKLEERAATLKKYGETPRVVEPQLKEGPGGLRDLHVAMWLTQARNHLASGQMRGERGFQMLVREAKVSPLDVQHWMEAKERIFRARCALHAVCGAERDQLVITRQEEVAELLGYGAPHDTEGTGETPPVERFMAALYEDLALNRRLSVQVMHRMENSRLMLGIGLDCKRKRILPANDALDSDDPAWLLWACELAQRHNLDFAEELETAAVSLISTRPILPDPTSAAAILTRLLSSTGKVYPILQRMADLGILGWILPEFGEVMNLIPYDPSHDYTIGQHTLFVIRNLEQLLVDAPTEERQEMRRLLLELPHPEQLMLAALLHDCGKSEPGRPHAEVSEEMAIGVCERLGWSEEAAHNVLFLVREHLIMAETSRLRDLSVEQTLRDFTRLVDDPDRLNMLYLLTYADTRAVGEGVWTQVKERQLHELWRRAAAILNEEEPLGYDEATIARARRRLLKDLAPENIPEEEINEHVQAMPPHYLLNQSLTDIGLHIGYVRQVRAGTPVVAFHHERDATYTEVTVCTVDDPRPGLLAKIAAVLYAADLDVHSAQVITRVTDTERIALDTLWVDYRGRPLAPGKCQEIEGNLQAVFKGERTVEEILSRRREKVRHSHYTPPDATLHIRSIRNDLSDTLTVIETAGRDARGALYRATAALSRLGWDIRSARVSSFRGEAVASFYLAGVRGTSESEIERSFNEALAIDA